MQHVTFANSRKLNLVGDLYNADSSAVIILAHGFQGDKSWNGRSAKLAAMYNYAGFDVLSFDFSGCGESDGDRLTVTKQVDDMRAAIMFVQSRGYSQIALHGYSLGGFICLKAYTPAVSTMILTGALTGPLHYNWRQHFSRRQVQEWEEERKVTVPVKLWPPRQIVVDRHMAQEVAEINQRRLFSSVHCPLLLMHGNADFIEQLFLTKSRQAQKQLPPGSKIEVIDGATHRFQGHFDHMSLTANLWMRDHVRHA